MNYRKYNVWHIDDTKNIRRRNLWAIEKIIGQQTKQNKNTNLFVTVFNKEHNGEFMCRRALVIRPFLENLLDLFKTHFSHLYDEIV